MKTFAEFQIIGRVGTVTPAGPTLKVSIAADDGRRTDKGAWEGKPSWNTVTLFNESIIRWARDNLGQGDLVHARGTLRETSYDKDDGIRYGVRRGLLGRLAGPPDEGASIVRGPARPFVPATGTVRWSSPCVRSPRGS